MPAPSFSVPRVPCKTFADGKPRTFSFDFNSLIWLEETTGVSTTGAEWNLLSKRTAPEVRAFLRAALMLFHDDEFGEEVPNADKVLGSLINPANSGDITAKASVAFRLAVPEELDVDALIASKREADKEALEAAKSQGVQVAVEASESSPLAVIDGSVPGPSDDTTSASPTPSSGD